jgi:non-specific serine/threonine protein kinase
LLTPRQALKQVFGGLTDRELDVARGYTNRQIADALVLSERTVTTHIGHILAKLGFSSRALLARWAAEQGIAPQ